MSTPTTAADHIRTCVRRALVYVDQGQDDLASSSLMSDVRKFGGDWTELGNYNVPAIVDALPFGRVAVLAACELAGLGPAEAIEGEADGG